MEKKHQYQGLTKQEVEESRRLHGENILTPPEKASLWSQFLEKFNDPIIKILLVAWLLSMIIAGVHCWGPEAKGFYRFPGADRYILCHHAGILCRFLLRTQSKQSIRCAEYRQ